jgi:hypothetical protein
MSERDEWAWVIHRAYGCGPTDTADGPGPVCEPDWEDYGAADAVLRRLAEHDRMVSADVWEEGYRACASDTAPPNPYRPDDC